MVRRGGTRRSGTVNQLDRSPIQRCKHSCLKNIDQNAKLPMRGDVSGSIVSRNIVLHMGRGISQTRIIGVIALGHYLIIELLLTSCNHCHVRRLHDLTGRREGAGTCGGGIGEFTAGGPGGGGVE